MKLVKEELEALRAAHHAEPHCSDCGRDLPADFPLLPFCSVVCMRDFYANTVLCRMPNRDLVAYLTRNEANGFFREGS